MNNPNFEVMPASAEVSRYAPIGVLDDEGPKAESRLLHRIQNRHLPELAKAMSGVIVDLDGDAVVGLVRTRSPAAERVWNQMTAESLAVGAAPKRPAPPAPSIGKRKRP